MDSSLPELDHRQVETNGVCLHAVTAGPAAGDPVVLLHGFPEFWYGWRHQIPALTAAGYRVIVPDQRGYNLSDKPRGLDAYRLTTLAADIDGLLDSLGYDQCAFVGHDWGAAVLWQLLLEYPERATRAVTMNVPHPAVFEEYLFGDLRQTLHSSYMFFFQLPHISEWLMSRGGFRLFLGTTNSEAAFTEEDLDRYREAWEQPGAPTGMLNWYRSLFRRGPGGVPTVTVETPTMVIWGTQDPYLRSVMGEESIEYCTDGHYEPIHDATHWVQHESPERVNDLLLDFLDGK